MTNHFHSIKDGCVIKIHYKRPRYRVVYINFVKCEIHHKIICRCGYEKGWHNNECSKKIYPKGKQDLTHLLDSSIIKIQ